ncbi:hypothetical protein N9L86_01585 [Euryarchaeota archaeon]|nr:hypothetical protein [Euryarchaeota archaeon]
MVHGLGLNEMSIDQPLGASSDFFELIWLLPALICWKGRTICSVVLTNIVEPLSRMV